MDHEPELTNEELLAEVAALATVEEPPPPEGPRRGRKLVRALLVVVCLSLGLGASAAVRIATAPKPAAAPEEPHEEAKAKPKEPVVLDDAARIDGLIREAAFHDALAACKTTPKAFGDEHALQYRLGLAHEGLTKWDAAVAAYRKALDPDGDPAAWARVTLGLARCAAATGDVPTATKLVSAVVLRSGHPTARQSRVAEECRVMRARLAVQRLGPRPTPGPLDQTALAWPALAVGAEHYLELLAPVSRKGHPSAAEYEPHPVEVSRTWSGRVVVSAHVPSVAAGELLRAVVAAGGFPVRFEPGTEAKLPATLGEVHVERAGLAEVLAALTEPHGLDWAFDGTTVVVRPAGKPTPAAAALALQRALSAAADHPFARAARVTMANLDYEAGHYKDAVAGYRDLLDEAAHAREGREASYNLGLDGLRTGDVTAARGRFLDVVDHGHGTRWEALGWWWIGRAYLDGAEPDAALRPLRTALAGDKDIRSAATLGLCVAHLLRGEPADADDTLRRGRVSSDDEHLALAAMFEAVTRHRVAPSASRRDAAVAALRAAGDGRRLGPAGVFVAGQAYRALGDGPRMVALYDTAPAHGRLAVRMAFTAAEFLDAQDLRTAARARYLGVSAADPDGLGPRAALRVADLDARDGRGADCVRRCRGLAGKPGVAATELLAVLGRGYELEGNHAAAAQCFAGRLPE